MSVSLIDEVRKYLPIIYVPKERENRRFLGALVEKPDNYFIIWYHWPFNDYNIPPKEDYEPIILFILRTRLIAIGSRPGNQCVLKYPLPIVEGRPIVVFDTAWHHPRIHPIKSLLMSVTESQVFHVKYENYQLIEGKPPKYYTVADSDINIYEWADENCRELERAHEYVI